MQRNANNASHWSAESALEPVSELRGRKYFRSVANWSNLFSLLINKYLSSEYYKQWSPRDTAIGRNSNLNAFCVCVCSVMQSCLTVCDPMVCGPPDSSVYGIFQARILEWVAISYSRGSSPPRDQTCISCISCIGRQILYHWASWEASLGFINQIFQILYSWTTQVWSTWVYLHASVYFFSFFF